MVGFMKKMGIVMVALFFISAMGLSAEGAQEETQAEESMQKTRHCVLRRTHGFYRSFPLKRLLNGLCRIIRKWMYKSLQKTTVILYRLI